MLYDIARSWVLLNAWGTGDFAVMQADGNFVLYNASHVPLWSSGTISAGAHLVLANDGNLIVYSTTGVPLWATNTCCH